MKGQISVEMLILLVVIIGVVIVAASQLLNTAHKAGEDISDKTDDILNYCIKDTECKAGETCINNRCS